MGDDPDLKKQKVNDAWKDIIFVAETGRIKAPPAGRWMRAWGAFSMPVRSARTSVPGNFR